MFSLHMKSIIVCSLNPLLAQTAKYFYCRTIIPTLKYHRKTSNNIAVTTLLTCANKKNIVMYVCAYVFKEKC